MTIKKGTNAPGAIKSAHVIPDEMSHKVTGDYVPSRTSITQAPHHLTTTRTHALLSLLAFDGFALSRQREKVRRKEIKTRSAEHSVR